MTNPDVTPTSLGYRWPAEWERHTATWLSWPHNEKTWPGIFPKIPAVFAALVRTIAEFEPVQILAGGDHVRETALHYIDQLDNVTLHDIATNDAWCRDHGPTFLVQAPPANLATAPAGGLAMIDWQYNAWGGKYPPFDLDNAVPSRIANLLSCPRFAADVVLEGGAIEGNGAGTVITTASCLLNANRNPTLNQPDFERLLADYLSAQKVIWLEQSQLGGDDTDGHVDQLARFVAPRTVVSAVASNAADPTSEPLQANLRQLQSATDQHGATLEVVALPLPAPKFHAEHRLPASYCNFYFVNDGLIVPQFEDPNDERALAILRELLPDRTVIGLPAIDLVWGLGALHCLSQQQPRVTC